MYWFQVCGWFVLMSGIVVAESLNDTDRMKPHGQFHGRLQYGSCNSVKNRLNGEFTSENYPSKYHNNQKCVTVIRGLDRPYIIEITLHFFELERGSSACPYDYLQLSYNGQDLDQLCGTLWGKIITRNVSRGDVIATFHSDSTRPFLGFRATYEIHPDCNYDSSATRGSYSLTDYYNNMLCKITIRVPKSELSHHMVFHFDGLDIEDHPSCQRDSLTIEESGVHLWTLCGEKKPAFNLSYDIKNPQNSTFQLIFKSDRMVTGHGFTFHYEIKTSSCNVIVNGTEGVLTSPRGGFTHNLNCTYTINTGRPSVISITFDIFKIEYHPLCRFDSLMIGGIKYCGKKPVYPIVYLADNGQLVMTFMSDYSIQSAGFKMRFTSRGLI